MRLHDGFYLQFSLGGGYASVTKEGADPRELSKASFAGSFLIGGTVSGLVIGVGSVVAGVPDDGKMVRTSDQLMATGTTREATLNLGVVGPFLDYYPDPTKGFHLQALAGLSSISRDDDRESGVYRGAGFSLGVGQQWWIGEQWSLGVLGRLQYQRATSSRDGSETFKAVVPSVSLDIAYH